MSVAGPPLVRADLNQDMDPDVKLIGSSPPTVDNFWKNHTTGFQEIRRRDRPSISFQTIRVHTDSTLQKLLTQEDTNGDGQITVTDDGPRKFTLVDIDNVNGKSLEVKGTYYLGNLLQELSLAKEANSDVTIIDESIIYEDPVEHLCRRIKHMFWHRLTRRLDETLIDVAAPDPKSREENPRPRIYIPAGLNEQYEYYVRISNERPELNLDVQWLPSGEITARYMKFLNLKPGLLALGMKHGPSGQLKGMEFVVPGHRFNEFYGWDSYFCGLGLLQYNQVSLAKDMVSNFIFEIQHYGKILNANRSYYLLRSQPPFLTDFAIRIYKKTMHEPDANAFLKTAIIAAIKEYETVWMAEPRYDEKTGLTRFRPDGYGLPPEVEDGHYDATIEPLARKLGISIPEFIKAYQNEELDVPEFDEFLLHDRAVRESGHDTSYRVKAACADIATIDLNCLLYKYETDISWAICTIFDDKLEIPGFDPERKDLPARKHSSLLWNHRARNRKRAIDAYCWNEAKGTYYDFNTETGKQSTYETVTSFYALWSGISSPAQAQKVIQMALPRFECIGGLSVGDEESRGAVFDKRPQLQWDYPFGWACHQMLAWDGCIRYGYYEDAQRLAYRWLRLITKASMDYNGAVVEKYDVTRLEDPIKVEAEYGNQGTEFKGVAQEGFGWTNASYTYGLSIIPEEMRRALKVGASFEEIARFF